MEILGDLDENRNEDLSIDYIDTLNGDSSFSSVHSSDSDVESDDDVESKESDFDQNISPGHDLNKGSCIKFDLTSQKELVSDLSPKAKYLYE